MLNKKTEWVLIFQNILNCLHKKIPGRSKSIGDFFSYLRSLGKISNALNDVLKNLSKVVSPENIPVKELTELLIIDTKAGVHFTELNTD